MSGQISMKKPYNCRLATIAILLLPMGAYAQDPVNNALGKCVAIAADADRLACFDAIASVATTVPGLPEASEPPAAASAATAGAVVAVETAATAPAHEPISDEIGLERVKGAEKPEVQKYSATVTRCDENEQSGQTYFFFDNGQVWKQSRYRRLRFRDCQFEVSLAKDGFGYQMYIPDKDRTVRVTRIR